MTTPNDPASDPGAAPAIEPSTPGTDAPVEDTQSAGPAGYDAPPTPAAQAAPAAPAPPEDDFAAMFAASEKGHPSQPRAKTGDTVQGNVIAVGPENAFVAIGGKAEAVISLAEFRDPTTGEIALAIGDAITATITDDGSRSGSIVLKRTLGRGGRVPGEIEEAREHGLAIEGVVTGQNKGGFDVQVAGVRAFCPASQIDLRRADPAQYIGQRLTFRVTQISAGGRNVVVARRPLLEEEAAAQAASTWERLQVGATVRGTVTSLRDFGAFVDLGGVEGLIHVSELGY
ncbi:MAG TPA: S1 RNA-binding domain-containing protein, partial [Candidatus Binatia bacterium]